MASTQNAQISYTVQDEIGVKAAVTLYAKVDPTMTITQFAALLQGEAALVDAVLGAKVISGKAAIVSIPSGMKGSPVSGSRVEQTGLFSFGNASNTRTFGQDFPGWADSKISGGKIPLGDGDVAALTSSLDTPAALSEFVTNQFLVLTAPVRYASLTFRKHRRAERALTGEV